MRPSPDFGAVFHDLRAILAEYEPKLKTVHDGPHNYYLNTHTIGPNNRPIMFGAVRIQKNYVSYYLMSVYGQAELLASMSPELKKHMQGKACFNFRVVDRVLFEELGHITKNGYDAWKKLAWVE